VKSECWVEPEIVIEDTPSAKYNSLLELRLWGVSFLLCLEIPFLLQNKNEGLWMFFAIWCRPGRHLAPTAGDFVPSG
jgi:hypothetical protein